MRTIFELSVVANDEKWADDRIEKGIRIPLTCIPGSRDGKKSVTIIATNAGMADAMATPLMITGIYTGLDMINQMKNTEAIIIDDDDKMYTSKNINIKKKP